MRSSLANDMAEEDEGVVRSETLKEVAMALAELEYEIFLGSNSHMS